MGSIHTRLWGITYSFKNLKICISGDVGYSVTVNIAGKDFPLWQYDRTVNNAMKTNKINILWQLKVLKRFLHRDQGGIEDGPAVSPVSGTRRFVH